MTEQIGRYTVVHDEDNFCEWWDVFDGTSRIARCEHPDDATVIVTALREKDERDAAPIKAGDDLGNGLVVVHAVRIEPVVCGPIPPDPDICLDTVMLDRQPSARETKR